MEKIRQVQQEEAKNIQEHEVIGTLQINQAIETFVTLKSVNCGIRPILFNCRQNKPHHSLINELELAIYICPQPIWEDDTDPLLI